MKKGFSLIALIVVVAILAIGGGLYFSSQNSSEEVNTENDSSEQNTESKGTFRSLMSLGKSYKCNIKTIVDGVLSEGVVYLDTNKRMRSDFTVVVNGQSMSPSVIMLKDVMYSWTGEQGIKMSIKEEDLNTQNTVSTNQNFNLDQEVEYKCEDWNVEESLFVPPSNVNFFELGPEMFGVPQA